MGGSENGEGNIPSEGERSNNHSPMLSIAYRYWDSARNAGHSRRYNSVSGSAFAYQIGDHHAYLICAGTFATRVRINPERAEQENLSIRLPPE